MAERESTYSLYDGAGNSATDVVGGFPVVDVLIEEGFRRPNAPIAPKFVRVLALIDTGADYTIIRPDLAAGKEQVRTITARVLEEDFGPRLPKQDSYNGDQSPRLWPSLSSPLY